MRNQIWAQSLGLFAATLVVLTACTSGAAQPEDFVYRARIDDCRITTPQLGTVFRVSDRLLVTAAHPFEGIRSFELLDVDGQTLAADIVAMRSDKDLALLWLREPASAASVAVAPEPVQADTPVQIITFDRDGNLIVQEGLALRRANVTLDGEDPRKAIELQADIESGDSGAPVLFEGRAVGVVFAASRGRQSGWAVSQPEIAALIADVPEEPVPVTLGCADS
jgi:S1-C subfamily serine protease